MKTRTILATILIIMGAQTLLAQEHVTNIRVTQEDKMVVIKYDLAVRSDVKLLISVDDGEHFTDTMNVTGMVNKIVPAGKNKIIRWQAFKNLGYSDYPEIRFKFVTEEEHQVARPKQIPERTFISLFNFGSPNLHIRDGVWSNGLFGIEPFSRSEPIVVGIAVGHVEKYGWFASVMTNCNFKGFSPDAISDENWQVRIKDEMGNYYDVLPFYCGVGAYSELSVIGGGMMRLINIIYLKAGLGYGHRSVSLKTYDGRWIRNRAYTANNVDVDLGIMFNFCHFVLSIDGVISMDGLSSWSNEKHGTTATLFKMTPTVEPRIGLGYSF